MFNVTLFTEEVNVKYEKKLSKTFHMVHNKDYHAKDLLDARGEGPDFGKFKEHLSNQHRKFVEGEDTETI